MFSYLLRTLLHKTFKTKKKFILLELKLTWCIWGKKFRLSTSVATFNIKTYKSVSEGEINKNQKPTLPSGRKILNHHSTDDQRQLVWLTIIPQLGKQIINLLSSQHFILFFGIIWAYPYCDECRSRICNTNFYPRIHSRKFKFVTIVVFS